MIKYGEIQEDFYTERTRILDTLDAKENQHVVMRLIGALAFRTHCPKYGYLQDALGREFTDFDFASYPKYFKDVIRILTSLGYVEDKMVTRLFGDGRLLFNDPKYSRHIDVFLNRLDFSHVVPFEGRLEVEKYTLPLAELLLEKMQIFQINEKDLIDTIMLLREHPIGETDDETINAVIVAGMTSKDWGLWRTVTGNLRLVDEILDKYPTLTQEDRSVVRERLATLQDRIENHPKTLAWKGRAIIGEKKRWYKDVEELMDR